MYVTSHAQYRLEERLGVQEMVRIAGLLERTPGVLGSVAYICASLHTPVIADDGSNGDTVIAVSKDGSVETVFIRRSSQDMSAEFFGAREVVDLTLREIMAAPRGENQ